MTVSMGRSAPLKDHFVVSWTATMVVKYRCLGFLWMGGVPRRHDRPELLVRVFPRITCAQQRVDCKFELERVLKLDPPAHQLWNRHHRDDGPTNASTVQQTT